MDHARSYTPTHTCSQARYISLCLHFSLHSSRDCPAILHHLLEHHHIIISNSRLQQNWPEYNVPVSEHVPASCNMEMCSRDGTSRCVALWRARSLFIRKIMGCPQQTNYVVTLEF